jgi:cytochrome c peroxidase
LSGLDLLVNVPEDNPLTVESVSLGERLFFDATLSADGVIRCASSHRPGHSFSDTVPISAGVYGRLGVRNTPAIVNRAYGRAFFWDGRAASLETQVLHPIQDSTEMGQPLPALLLRLRANQFYRDAFARAFGGGIDTSEVARALSNFVRTVRSGNAPIDRWRDGDTAAISSAARRGLSLFTGRANCITCHAGPNFTDEEFHNTGVAARSAAGAALSDSGRFRVTGRAQDIGAFKTPTLRDVALTGPYLHDGSISSLDDAVAFYDAGGHAHPQLDPEIRPLELTPEQRHDLVAFLRALTGTPPHR